MTVSEQIEALNQHLKETDAIYHSAAVRFGLSDSAFWILYAIADSRRTYTQNELCGAWSYSKQTVNSAIQSLIRQGYVRLEAVSGTRNSKTVRLTEAGRAFSEKTVQRLWEADQKAFGRLSAQERETFLKLSEKYLVLFREEADRTLLADDEQP